MITNHVDAVPNMYGLLTMKENIRVLIADDHMIARTGLVALLKQEHRIDIVGEATDGKMAVELAQKLQPDVIIMDIRMPVLNGIEATRLIKSDYPETKVIGFTMHSESDLGDAMLKAGAAACISKSDPIELLIAEIRN
jgi:DNA-binding NarL/FixJ family response regulator